MKKFLLSSVLALLMLSPVIAFGAGLIPDCNVAPGTAVTAVPATDAQGKAIVDAKGNPVYNYAIGTPCGLNQLVQLVNNIINFIIVDLAGPIFAIVIAYAGFLLITSGGNSEKANKAKGALLNALKGFLLVLVAWLIVKTILNAVGFPDAYSFLSK